ELAAFGVELQEQGRVAANEQVSVEPASGILAAGQPHKGHWRQIEDEAVRGRRECLFRVERTERAANRERKRIPIGLRGLGLYVDESLKLHFRARDYQLVLTLRRKTSHPMRSQNQGAAKTVCPRAATVVQQGHAAPG